MDLVEPDLAVADHAILAKLKPGQAKAFDQVALHVMSYSARLIYQLLPHGKMRSKPPGGCRPGFVLAGFVDWQPMRGTSRL
ncbi:hypothetical protein [Rubellimicrobium arenae]|uniref:hypothetical protein n=1 Tax=Rubellimicrobium arenae TaxID=2817372 RepID=UPI001B315834|nr:hypothetical protein [Rubellimicrobium arenae]